jgi:hypothetical protein
LSIDDCRSQEHDFSADRPGSTMTKDDLIAQLHTTLTNFVFGVALRCCFPQELWQKITTAALEFEHGVELAKVELRPLANRMTNPVERQSLFDEYEKSLKRSLLRESHELICNYCEKTGQFSIYKTQPWYGFARIIRNTISHKDGGVMHKWPDDKVKIAKWRTRTLESSMVGQAIEFTPFEALRLVQDQADFVSSNQLT